MKTLFILKGNIGRLLELMGQMCLRLAASLKLDQYNKRWLQGKGDETLRLNYAELDDSSLVVDLGGYKGQWASDIFAKYRCSLYVLEPVPLYAQNIKKRFLKNPKIQVFQIGLANESHQVDISLAADGSSTFIKGNDSVKISLVKATDFFQEHHIQQIALMKINIEGGEYDLLEHLLDTGFIKNINNIQVQFHDFVPDANIKMKNIQNRLAQTHRLTYQYPFVWENWKRIQ